ncbi:MAG: hypothetical protein IH587_03470, partial [Anaerolineae bacterium]|nr:hypothetical protein [Anaerolineae bacterium]
FEIIEPTIARSQIAIENGDRQRTIGGRTRHSEGADIRIIHAPRC